MSRSIQIGGKPYRVRESLGYNPDVGARVLQVEDVAGMRHTAVGSRGAYRLWTASDRLRPGSKVRGQSDA